MGEERGLATGRKTENEKQESEKREKEEEEEAAVAEEPVVEGRRDGGTEGGRKVQQPN